MPTAHPVHKSGNAAGAWRHGKILPMAPLDAERFFGARPGPLARLRALISGGARG
jgi:hypothetical protein